MGFLERAIRRGISDAVGKAVQKAVEPKATELANRAADDIDRAVRSTARQTAQTTAGFEGALGNLQRSMEGYATEAAKNMKICPDCEAVCTADKKFCPQCGTALSELTVAQGAVCTACGTQNTVGTQFCAQCGAKLPAALQQEQAQASRDAEVMARWEQLLPQYPRWACGGTDVNIEQLEPGRVLFAASFRGDNAAARQAVEQYRALAERSGFRQAGEYPSREHLYKKLGGVCYHIDTEHCFDGDSDCPTLGFDQEEPCGGFDYVRPQPRARGSILDLFK